MKKFLFLILIALNAIVLHAYEVVTEDLELTSLFAMQADETVVLLDSTVTYLPDGSFSAKTVYEYDDKGRLTRETMCNWKEGSWHNSQRTEYRYDKNEKLRSLERLVWEPYGWERYYKDEWTYDDHGNPVRWNRAKSYRGEYTSGSRTKYENTYDNYGNLTNVIECQYDDYDRKWVNIKKIENTYNGSNLLTCTVQYCWEDDQWQPEKKHEYTYDANGNLTIDDSSGWRGYWSNSLRCENTYDDNGHLLSHSEFYGGGWDFQTKTEYTYDAEGNIADKTYFQWDFDSKKLAMNSYTVYSYSAHTVILPGTPTASDKYDFELDGIEYSILSIEDCTVEVSDTRHVEFEELVIPASFSFKGRELKVVAIGNNAIKTHYYNHYGQWESRYFETIQLPETVETIGRGAFSSQIYLEEIEFPETLTSIGNYAFAGCSNLKRVSLHEGFKSLGDSAFYYCLQLEEINLPDSVEEIGMYAFSHTGLRSFDFPASTRYVGSHLFANCDNLEYVNLEKLQTMGELPSALFYEAGVKKVVIPDWATEIPDYFVSQCKGIKEFEFGKSVVRIKENAFMSCNLPASFRLPETLKVIDNYAFSSATAEGSIVISGNVEEIGGYALDFTCDSLIFEPGEEALLLNCKYGRTTIRSHYLRLKRSIRMKDGSVDKPYRIYLYGEIIALGKDILNAFAQSENYEIIYDRTIRLSILEGVEDLNYNYDCQYTHTLLLPSTLKTIGTSNFVGAKNLTSIDCRATEPPLCDGKIFADVCYAKAKLTVPLGCKDAYMKAEGWKNFWEIEETAESICDESGNGISEVQDEDSYWFSISNGKLKAAAALDLYSLDGRLVKHAANGDVSDIAHGMYIIKCGTRTAKIAL